MRIAEYKQIDTRIEKRTRIVPIETKDGETVGERAEEYEVYVPVMGMVHRDMTPEEEAQYIEEQQNLPPVEPTVEEQLEDLKDIMSAMLEVM